MQTASFHLPIQCAQYVTIFLLTLLCTTAVCSAQDDTTETSSPIYEEAFDDALLGTENVIGYFIAPASFTLSDWGVLAAVFGGTAALIPTDEASSDFFITNQSAFADDVFSVAWQYGNLNIAQAFAITTYVAGLTVDDEEIKVTGRMLGESIVISGLLALLIKTTAGRARPYISSDPYDFRIFKSEDPRWSFPSGHTTVAFAVSSVLAHRVKPLGLKIGFYSLAGLTAISSVYRGQHWLSDAFIGAAIGTSAGMFSAYAEKMRLLDTEHGRLTWYPRINGIGIAYQIK